MQNFRKLTISALAEPGKRLVSACLAVAILASSCPLASYARANAAQHPLPQPPAAAEGSRRSGEAEKHRGAGRQRPVGRQQASPSGSAAAQLPDSIGLSGPLTAPAQVVEDEVESVGGRMEVTPVDTVDVDLNRRSLSERFPEYAAADSLTAGEALLADSIAAEARKPKPDEWVEREVAFNPDPTRAVWMSALFPGLGQIYNRRYWKLPIIVGGYMGLAYATNWNNGMLTDYTKAYSDLLDNDPETRSYMDLFSPNVKEENIDKQWLQNVIRSRRNYFRRNRDLCIICMVGVYLIAMVDAYVDASLSHFDISPDLSVDLAPAVIQDGRNRYPSVGLMWAFNF
ncbi:MAG: hypothetical protein K2K36_00980 [Muribaculaceae bacterium]|nr:hypothetical protein [Muribaculaceae bacterium]